MIPKGTIIDWDPKSMDEKDSILDYLAKRGWEIFGGMTEKEIEAEVIETKEVFKEMLCEYLPEVLEKMAKSNQGRIAH